MAIEKKSLIGNRGPVKKAKIASQHTEASESIGWTGENKQLKVQTLKVTSKACKGTHIPE